MSENTEKVHTASLQSSLFKSHHEWYYCFLKSERIAHVLTVLAQHVPKDVMRDFHALRDSAGEIPTAITHMAAGSVAAVSVLADIFSLQSRIRLLSTREVLTKETSAILLKEYEMLIKKLDTARLSTIVTSEDFSIPLAGDLPPVPLSASLPPSLPQNLDFIKDTHKRHTPDRNVLNNRSQRAEAILSFIRSNKSATIKDISRLADPIIRGCSEKTVQRELVGLVQLGLVRRVGERRWSQYLPA